MKNILGVQRETLADATHDRTAGTPPCKMLHVCTVRILQGGMRQIPRTMNTRNPLASTTTIGVAPEMSVVPGAPAPAPEMETAAGGLGSGRSMPESLGSVARRRGSGGSSTGMMMSGASGDGGGGKQALAVDTPSILVVHP